MSRLSRSGFSVYSLIVVLALLAILIGLLLPAVQKVREAAARMQSQNNMKMLALGVHSFHDVYGRMPSGVDKNNFSATAHILPFIEQENVYKQINFKLAIDAKGNKQIGQTVVPILLSPLDPLTAAKPRPTTNYLFCGGGSASMQPNDRFIGVFYKNSQVTLPIITARDGSSNTVMIGETLIGDGANKAKDVRRQHVEFGIAALAGLKDSAGVNDFKNNKNIAANRGHSWIDGRFLQGTFTGTRRVNDPRPDVNCGGTGGLSGLRSIYPYANVAFCDGSVHVIRTRANEVLWQRVCGYQDGFVVNFGDF